MPLIEWEGRLIDRDAQLRELDRADAEESLHFFLKKAWKYIDPAPFTDGWVIEALAEHLEAVADGEIRRLLINIPPRHSKSSICSVAFPAWIWAQEYESPTSGPGVPIVSGSYAFKLSVRDSVKCRRLIASPWYQSLWGHRFSLLSDSNQKIRFGNTRGGERIVTAVDGGITGEGGNIIIIDDPNNAKEVLSEAVIEATNEDWWDGTMSTRLNDPKTGAYIVIQQRLGEADLTGHILSKPSGKDWTHLMLPAEYEPQRAFVTSIGWEDPRTEPGELLWPERMGHAEIASLKADLGSWRCNPGEAPILMADTTMRPIRDIRIGDEIMGFDKKQRTDDKTGRMKLTKAVVTEIHSFVSPVVKMTLDSGEIIRCTRDHRWYLKDRGPTREMYGQVVLGRTKLARVCPPRLPELSAGDQRRAGWLSGFFDGEGTVSQQQRPGTDYNVGTTIAFYQGSGRNKPLCDKLEENLRHFGFEFTYAEDERKPNKDAPCYGYRTYRIKSDGLPTFQRFLHIVQPTKWRDRLQSGIFKTNFVKGREKVVKIEPDGEEVVYGLTTTTGNYVVWGLASSNSAGQLQQRPEPAGGGIIKREHWQLWPPEGEETDRFGRIIKPAAYPPMDYILASVDTAFTEKTMNDESALTIWGVFSGETVSRDLKTSPTSTMRVTGETSAKVMLMYCWHGRLELHELVNTIAKHCKQYRVDKILIENKASGISVAQEMRRLFSTEGFAIQLNDPGNVDKLARLYSVQNIFEEGQVYAPERQWSEDVIAQCGTFPNAKHDDIVDTVSQALRHLRDLGLIVRPAERMQELNESLSFVGSSPAPLYPA